jgi:hemophore
MFICWIGEPPSPDGTIWVGRLLAADHQLKHRRARWGMSANREELSMTTTATGAAGAATSNRGVRRLLHAVFATCAVGAAAAVATAGPSATAANDPCAASEIARTIGTVATNTGNYLDSHPSTNAVLTAASQQPGPQAVASLKTYFDANPHVEKDMQTLQQPLTSLTGKCRLPITLPQLLQMMQGAQQAQSAAQAVGLPSPANAALPAATGPLPGPAGAPPVVLAPAPSVVSPAAR